MYVLDSDKAHAKAAKKPVITRIPLELSRWSNS